MIPNIPEPILNLLHEIGEVAGKNAYLVGGFVRDLLLKRPSLDIDIVVEGDATLIAKGDVRSVEWDIGGASTIRYRKRHT